MTTVHPTPPEGQTKVKQNAPSGDLTLEEALSRLDALKTRPRRAVNILGRNLHLCVDGRVATTLMECALLTGRLDVAEQVLTVAADPSGLLRAQVYLAQGRAAKAAAALNTPPCSALERARFHALSVRTQCLAKNYTAAVTAAFDWAKEVPDSPKPFRTLARALADQDDPRAQDWFECALVVSQDSSACRLDLAEWLAEHGKPRSARAHLEALHAVDGPAAQRRDKILCAL